MKNLSKTLLVFLLASPLSAVVDETKGPAARVSARFLWKGELTNMPDYCTIRTFTIEPHKSAVIETVKSVSVEEAPMVTITLFDAEEERL